METNERERMSTPTISDGAPIASVDVELVVKLTVVPKIDQSLDDASAEMTQLFMDYVTGENNWLDDYGVKLDELRAWIVDPEGTDLGLYGWEGPFCLAATVRQADTAVTEGAEYFRAIGDQYAKIALEAKSPAAKTANAAEAAKYYGMAERIAAAEASSAE